MANNINNTTLEKILDSYVKRDFGSMTKNDFEVWIFHQLLNGELHAVLLKLPRKVYHCSYQ